MIKVAELAQSFQGKFSSHKVIVNSQKSKHNFWADRSASAMAMARKKTMKATAALVPVQAVFGTSRQGECVNAGYEPGYFRLRQQVTANPPLAAFDGARYWLLESHGDSSSGLGEITKVLPLHFHTDGEHRVSIIEGVARVQVGHATYDMRAGDYVRIPKGTIHKFSCVSQEPVWFVTFDSPPMDPDNFFWVEPAPGSSPTNQHVCPMCATSAPS